MVGIMTAPHDHDDTAVAQVSRRKVGAFFHIDRPATPAVDPVTVTHGDGGVAFRLVKPEGRDG
jgi:hypothetical protein